MQLIEKDEKKLYEESQSLITSAEHNSIINKYSMLPEEMQNTNLNNKLCKQIYAYLKPPGKIAMPTIYVNSCRINNSLLMKAAYLWISEGEQLRLKIIKKMHDQPAVDHLDTEKTLNMLYRYCYWSGMHGHIEQYLCNCHVCKQAKSAKNAYNGFFQSLLILKRP